MGKTPSAADTTILRLGHMRALRILFVLEYFSPHVGGVETLFDNLTAALARDGHRVTVVTLRLPGTRVREMRNGVRIIRVRTPQRARRYLFTLMSLPVVLRHAVRADIIQTTTYNAAIPAWLAATIARKPVVVTVHEVFADQWNNLIGLHPVAGYGFRAFEWAVLHLPFTHYICDSAFTRGRLQRFMGVTPARSSAVYPAIDYAFWDVARHTPRDVKGEHRLDAGRFLYLYFGRPGISKGIEYLIEAAARVRDRLPQSHLLMILADDPRDQYARIRQRIAQLGLADHITVRDPVLRADLPGYLLGADCVVVPSVSEGFGYSAIEAATLGCRVIATSGHSVEEVVAAHVTLVPPRDPEALAAAIIGAAAARPTTAAPRRFDMATHVAQVEAIFGRIVARR
jgi:D-inositol-3-phosphate glycosyltransferase